MKVIHFLVIFILATTCSTLKVPVMSGQLKVTYQTTASENHSCNQVVLFTLVSFHFKKTSLLSVHPYQLSLQEHYYLPADMKLYNYILLVFTKQEVDVEKNI